MVNFPRVTPLPFNTIQFGGCRGNSKVKDQIMICFLPNIDYIRKKYKEHY